MPSDKNQSHKHTKMVNVIKMPGENNGEMKDGALGTKHCVLTWLESTITCCGYSVRFSTCNFQMKILLKTCKMSQNIFKLATLGR